MTLSVPHGLVVLASYTGFPRSCNNTVQTDLRTRKITSGKFDSSQAYNITVST